MDTPEENSKVEIVTSWVTLMHYAKLLGDARRSGYQKLIEETERNHDEYRDICLRSDKMIVGVID